MRSRTIRWTAGIVAWVAVIATAWVVVRSERQAAARDAVVRHFEEQTRAIQRGLSDLSAAQQAYVAVGQGVGFWSPRVAQAVEASSLAITGLHQSASSLGGRASLDEA